MQPNPQYPRFLGVSIGLRNRRENRRIDTSHRSVPDGADWVDLAGRGTEPDRVIAPMYATGMSRPDHGDFNESSGKPGRGSIDDNAGASQRLAASEWSF